MTLLCICSVHANIKFAESWVVLQRHFHYSRKRPWNTPVLFTPISLVFIDSSGKLCLKVLSLGSTSPKNTQILNTECTFKSKVWSAVEKEVLLQKQLRRIAQLSLPPCKSKLLAPIGETTNNISSGLLKYFTCPTCSNSLFMAKSFQGWLEHRFFTFKDWIWNSIQDRFF